MLIALKLLAELLDDIPNGHPGCIVASAAYQKRLFNAAVRAANRTAVLGWRRRFLALFEEIAAAHPPRQPVDLVDLADHVTVVIEGAFVMSRALGDPRTAARQVMLPRAFLRLLFA